jgi:hypothetical protein
LLATRYLKAQQKLHRNALCFLPSLKTSLDVDGLRQKASSPKILLKVRIQLYLAGDGLPFRGETLVDLAIILQTDSHGTLIAPPFSPTICRNLLSLEDTAIKQKFDSVLAEDEKRYCLRCKERGLIFRHN